MKSPGRRSSWALLTLCAAILFPAGCTSTRAESPWVSWTTLRLKARAVPLLTGRVEMHVDRSDERTLLATQTQARFLGAVIARSRTESILEPATLRTRLHTVISKDRARRYTFDKNGYTMEKLKAAGDTEASLADWTVGSSSRHDAPVDEAGAHVALYDYYAMLLRLRRSGLDKPGDSVTLYVATKDGPRAYTITVGEARAGKRTFTDLSTGRDKTLPTRELRLRVVPADPGHADEGFLDMEGETELWVEAESKTLLQIAGNVPKVPGRIRLTLAAMG